MTLRLPNRSRRAALLLLLAAAGAAAAAGTAGQLSEDTILYPGATAAAEPPASPAAGALRVVFAAVLLGGLAVGAAVLWRKRQGVPAATGRNRLRLEEIRPLGQKQFLAVASYDDEKFLVAVCPGQIRLLSRLGEGGREPWAEEEP